MALKFIILLFSVSLCWATEYESIVWRSTNVVLVDTVVDGYRQVVHDTKCKKIRVGFEYSGLTDSTVLDVKRMEDDTAVSLFGTGNFPVIFSNDKSIIKEWDVVIDLKEKDIIRMDVLRAAKGVPHGFFLEMLIEKGEPNQF